MTLEAFPGPEMVLELLNSAARLSQPGKRQKTQ
jgi:hypothetical protein